MHFIFTIKVRNNYATDLPDQAVVALSSSDGKGPWSSLAPKV